MNKTPSLVLKEIGMNTLLQKFNNNLALIKEYFKTQYGFDSKNLSRIMKQFREFLQNKIDKNQEIKSVRISEIILALKNYSNEV